jgi:hypothetical protein
MPSNKHASSIISSDYPMASTHRDIFPSNAQQQARIGYYFQRLPDAKHTSRRISIKCPTTSTHRVMFQAVTRQQERIGSCFQRLPKECSRRVPKCLFLARLSGRFVTRRALFVTHRGISIIFSFITPWDMIARGIEPEMPLIARRSAHFVTRRLIS